MSYLKVFYNEVFYRPLLGALVFLTSILPGHDLGFAVILLTVFIRTLMFPFTHQMLKTQSAMKRIEPEVKKIYAEKKNKEDQTKALMELYRAHGINPLSGFFMLLIQLPLLFAMYQVFWLGVPFRPEEVYPFLNIPASINTMFLGFINLTEASILLAALAAASQFLQAKLATVSDGGEKKDMQRAIQMQMTYFFPILIFFIAFRLPAAVSLYWTAMNVFAIVHEAVVRKRAASDGNK